MNHDPYFTPQTKISLKFIIYLNIKSKLLKLLEEKLKKKSQIFDKKIFLCRDIKYTECIHTLLVGMRNDTTLENDLAISHKTKNSNPQTVQ